MTREEVFEAWAPLAGTGDAGWSDWVKPVLFAQMPIGWSREESLPALPDVPVPEFEYRGAVVVDLPGEEGVYAAMVLARRGFRPVPLYNAAANGEFVPLSQMGSPLVGAAINMWPIMGALWCGADPLRRLPIAPDAPPAFLLDSRRRAGERFPGSGMMDNRWVSFPTDFPSARMLLDRGIHEAMLVAPSFEPAADLGHTLRRWQEAGIVIHHGAPGVDAVPREIGVGGPSRFRAAWHQFLTTFGLRRSLLGGFGGVLPQPSSG